MSPAAPRSWAEDLNTYRASRGSQAFSTWQAKEQPYRIPRTKLCPLGDPQHKAFSTGDSPYKGNAQDGSLERYARHGWGDVSMLKPNSTRPTNSDAPIKPRPPSPSQTKDGRNGLFGVLQYTEAGNPEVDSWMGHPLVNPKKGKLGLTPPTDATGRKNLFEVLDSRHPARPADDAWMGNMLVNPAKGKAHAAGPEERMGRKDLFALMQQRILTQPSTNAPSARRGQDGALTDAWLGNILMDPQKGKQEVLTTNNEDHLINMRWDPKLKQTFTLEWDNVIPRPQGKYVMGSEETPGKRDTMGPILRGKAKPPAEAHHPHIHNPESADMYAILAAQSQQQQNATARAPAVIHRKRVFQRIPGEEHTPIFEERFAWLVKPKPKPQKAADGTVVEQPISPMLAPTHPMGEQRDKPWH